MDSKCKVLIKMTPEKKVFSLIRNEKILESERLKIDTNLMCKVHVCKPFAKS